MHYIYEFDTCQILTKSIYKRIRRHRKAIYSILCKNLDFPFDMPFASCFCLKWYKIYFFVLFSHQYACACAPFSITAMAAVVVIIAAVLVVIVVLYAHELTPHVPLLATAQCTQL